MSVIFRRIRGRIVPIKGTSYAKTPSKNMTLDQLKRLEHDNFHNPDTGLELNAEEAQSRILELSQKRADKALARFIRKDNKIISRTNDDLSDLSDVTKRFSKTRSRGRAWIYHPVFKTIQGHRVPFHQPVSDEMPPF